MRSTWHWSGAPRRTIYFTLWIVGVTTRVGRIRRAPAVQGITGGTSRKGNCLDNPVVERFSSTLEHASLARQAFVSHQAARRAIFHDVKVCGDQQRRHSSIGDVSLVECEQWIQAA